jgi:hypothetical protein
MPERSAIPEALQERIKAVTNKRARFVLDSIVKNGSVSTIELNKAGYDHPPRAVRDAVELGFSLKRIKAKRDDGQSIAAYVFDEDELDPNKTGRVILSKKGRDALIVSKGSKCNICGATHNLQIDHRIPYEVAAETQKDEDDPYQILDGSCNRKKSWSCEHCENWTKLKSFDTCRTCYWANPESYAHVAMQQERRVDVVWTGGEVNAFEQLKDVAKRNGRSVADEIKIVLAQGVTQIP